MKNISYRAFTLIELLVVVAIIGILASVALSSLSGARKRALEARQIQEIKSLKNALTMYLMSNNGYPVVPGYAVNVGIPIAALGPQMAPYMKNLPTVTNDFSLNYVVDATNQKYGLRVKLETQSTFCITGDGFETTGWWGINPVTDRCAF